MVIHYLYLQTSGLPGPNFRSADFSLYATAGRCSQRVRLQRRDFRDSLQDQNQLIWSHCEPSSPWRELSLLSLFSLPSPLLSPPLLNLISKHSSIYQPCCLSIRLHVSSSRLPSRFLPQMSVSGYRHKQSILLSRIVEKMAQFQVDHQRFEVHKETLTRQLKNFHANQPYRFYITSRVLQTKVLNFVLMCSENMFEFF